MGNGGISGIMSMTLAEIMRENFEDDLEENDTIILEIFGSLKISDLMSAFLSK
jgi:hypothetical protein